MDKTLFLGQALLGRMDVAMKVGRKGGGREREKKNSITSLCCLKGMPAKKWDVS